MEEARARGYGLSALQLAAERQRLSAPLRAAPTAILFGYRSDALRAWALLAAMVTWRAVVAAASLPLERATLCSALITPALVLMTVGLAVAAVAMRQWFSHVRSTLSERAVKVALLVGAIEPVATGEWVGTRWSLIALASLWAGYLALDIGCSVHRWRAFGRRQLLGEHVARLSLGVLVAVALLPLLLGQRGLSVPEARLDAALRPLRSLDSLAGTNLSDGLVGVVKVLAGDPEAQCWLSEAERTATVDAARRVVEATSPPAPVPPEELQQGFPIQLTPPSAFGAGATLPGGTALPAQVLHQWAANCPSGGNGCTVWSAELADIAELHDQRAAAVAAIENWGAEGAAAQVYTPLDPTVCDSPAALVEEVGTWDRLRVCRASPVRLDTGGLAVGVWESGASGPMGPMVPAFYDGSTLPTTASMNSARVVQRRVQSFLEPVEGSDGKLVGAVARVTAAVVELRDASGAFTSARAAEPWMADVPGAALPDSVVYVYFADVAGRDAFQAALVAQAPSDLGTRAKRTFELRVHARPGSLESIGMRVLARGRSRSGGTRYVVWLEFTDPLGVPGVMLTTLEE